MDTLSLLAMDTFAVALAAGAILHPLTVSSLLSPGVSFRPVSGPDAGDWLARLTVQSFVAA